MTVLKPCVDCGEVAPGTRCDRCRAAHEARTTARKGSATFRGYDAAWSRLSARARRLQPFCTDCSTTDDLTADHLVWPARSLADVAVVCRPCNSKRGATRGERASRHAEGPSGEANFASHSSSPSGDSPLMPSRQTVYGSSPASFAAGRTAVDAVSTADDVTATNGTAPSVALHHRLQSSAQEAGAGLGFPQRLDPERELSTVEPVEVCDREVSAGHRHDVVHPAVRVVAQSPGHVTTVPVTDDAP